MVVEIQLFIIYYIYSPCVHPFGGPSVHLANPGIRVLCHGPLKASALVQQFPIRNNQRRVLHRPRYTSAGLQTSKAAICSGEGKGSKFPSDQAVTVSKDTAGCPRSSAWHSPGSGLSGHRSASGQNDTAASAVRARNAPPPAATPGSASLGQEGPSCRRYFLRLEDEPNFPSPSSGTAAGLGAVLTPCLAPDGGEKGS